MRETEKEVLINIVYCICFNFNYFRTINLVTLKHLRRIQAIWKVGTIKLLRFYLSIIIINIDAICTIHSCLITRVFRRE